jgi:hypothetical protein
LLFGRDIRRPPRREKRGSVNIRFVSSLSPEDENLFAPLLLKAASALLDQLQIAYAIRIETTGAQLFEHSHAANVMRPEPASTEVPRTAQIISTDRWKRDQASD